MKSWKFDLPIWKRKSFLEKFLTIVCYLLAVVILVLATLDLFRVASLIFYYEVLLGILLILEGVLYLKYDKKKSGVFIVLGIFILIGWLISLFF